MSSSSMRIITSSSTTRIRLACVAGCTSVAILHPSAGTGTHLGRIRLMMHCGCPGAKRWKRRREGMRYVRIPLHVTEIDELVRLGFLRGEQCQDLEALQAAVLGIIYGVLAQGARDSARMAGWRR